jgi:hypothetical protein
MTMLNRVERNGPTELASNVEIWSQVLDEPILAIGLEAIVARFLKKKDASLESLQNLHQCLRAFIFQTWSRCRGDHSTPLPVVPLDQPPLTDPEEVQALALNVLKDFKDHLQPGMRERIVSRIACLGEAQGVKAMAKAVFYLQVILCAQESTKQNVRWLEINQANPLGILKYNFNVEAAVEDYRRCDRFIRVTQFALTRVYLSLYDIAVESAEDSAEAIGWIRYASGGEAGSILNDLDDIRAGRSPYVLWMSGALRTNHPDTVSRSHILSEARALELEYGAVDGRPFPRESTSDALWEQLKSSPPRLLDGKTLERTRGSTEEKTMRFLCGLRADPRSDNMEVAHAITMVTLLIGDPRVDALSLLDWVQSLYGERRAFSDEQFTRFLQEANAFVPMAIRLNPDRKLIISREHRKDLSETLGASFDLSVVDAHNIVVETIEIKQTARPSVASNLGGIVRQATSKLDGVLAPLANANVAPPQFPLSPGAPPTLRHVAARHVLIIQFPWEWVPRQYTRGGVTFVTHFDGRVERWRPHEGKEMGTLLGQENLFIDIAKHLPRITDADYFDEIVLSNTHGALLVTYTHQRHRLSETSGNARVEGPWQIQSLVGDLWRTAGNSTNDANIPSLA